MVFTPVRHHTAEELATIHALTFGTTPLPPKRGPGRPPGPAKPADTRPRRRYAKRRPGVPMTPGQRLYKHARDLADSLHELVEHGGMGGHTRLRIATLQRFSQSLVAHTTLTSPGHRLKSAGQCEWISDHMAVCEQFVRQLMAHPRLSDYPKTVPHLGQIRANLYAIAHACRTFTRYHDRGPYDRSRHLCDTPNSEGDGE